MHKESVSKAAASRKCILIKKFDLKRWHFVLPSCFFPALTLFSECLLSNKKRKSFKVSAKQNPLTIEWVCFLPFPRRVLHLRRFSTALKFVSLFCVSLGYETRDYRRWIQNLIPVEKCPHRFLKHSEMDVWKRFIFTASSFVYSLDMNGRFLLYLSLSLGKKRKMRGKKEKTLFAKVKA